MEKIKKVVYVADTHGTKHWKEVINKEPDFDFIIFGGDYFDSFTIPATDQLENFRDILQFKRDNPEKVILLVGNHDYHYIPGMLEKYSGYQEQYSYLITQAMSDAIHENLVQMAFEYNNFLFTHAGVTKTFMKRVDSLVKGGELAERINVLFENKPGQFGFYGFDPYGDDITQGCLWVRPRSLESDKLEGYIQVVGHTRRVSASSPDIYFMDLMEDNPGYLVIQGGETSIKYLNDKQYNCENTK